MPIIGFTTTFLDGINFIVDFGNNTLWTYVIIGLLIGLGLFFTIRTKFVQFRLFGEMFRVITEKRMIREGYLLSKHSQ